MLDTLRPLALEPDESPTADYERVRAIIAFISER